MKCGSRFHRGHINAKKLVRDLAKVLSLFIMRSDIYTLKGKD